MCPESTSEHPRVSWWKPVLFASLAGGMAWGIRGQYGHETGAMIAGLLVSLTLVFLLAPRFSSLSAARAVAWCTVAIGFGGSMTYGQTVGLSQNSDVLGNWEALRWGMLGLGIKGGLWIGFGGLFLGMGLGGVRYRWKEMLGLMLSAVALYYVGMFFLNRPHDPEGMRLPWLYFSEHWHWTPDKVLKPRVECWGGELFAWAALTVYTGVFRKDGLAWRMSLWGLLGGALGFPGGQCVQAYHAWNPEVFAQGIWTNLGGYMNWWNMMETTFGLIMGASLGLGLWLHRARIRPAEGQEEQGLSSDLEGVLVALHIALLIGSDFVSLPYLETFYDPGVIMGVIPIVAIAGGRWWPYALALPVTLIPIAGKTVLALGYATDTCPLGKAWLYYLIVPLFISTAAALYFSEQGRGRASSRAFTRPALVISVWTYFLLNHAFFQWAWPWREWTGRTPNGIIFTVCAIALTLLALLEGHPRGNTLESSEPAGENMEGA